MVQVDRRADELASEVKLESTTHRDRRERMRADFLLSYDEMRRGRWMDGVFFVFGDFTALSFTDRTCLP